MKSYILDIIPRIKKHSERLDNIALLTSKNWVVIDEFSNNHLIYIFRPNKELLVSNNGNVKKAIWDYLGNDTLLIDIEDESFLMKQGFFDQNVLALKLAGKDEFTLMINESKYEEGLTTVDKIITFLKNEYLLKIIESTGINKIDPDKFHKTKSKESVSYDNEESEPQDNSGIWIVVLLIIIAFIFTVYYVT